MDNLAIEECEEIEWNGEFIPQITIPEDDEELDSLINELGM
ncbi:hypothetical protein PZS63_00620 [Klebsiella aerogenes]|nr:hypothetical protein [Klebsiella aerogenes]MEA8782131.1 hypothetical protein [Klebsiella aerogenes]